MSNRNKRDEAGGNTLGNAWRGTGFTDRRPHDTSRDTDDTDDTDVPPSPHHTEPSHLESWINGYDTEKAATGRRTPPIASAFSRLTYTPAAEEDPGSASATSSLNAATQNPWKTSPARHAPAPVAQDSRASSNSSPSASSSPFIVNSTPSSGLPSLYRPPKYRASSWLATPPPAQLLPPRSPFTSPVDSSSNSSTAYTPLMFNPNASPTPVTPLSSYAPRTNPQPYVTEPPSSISTPPLSTPPPTELVPINSWDSGSLTREWTRDQVLIAINRILGEIDLDWYEENYFKLDFDGSRRVVWILWEEITFAYIQYIRTYVTGLDILTLLAMDGGTLKNTKDVLANIICFFGAGKVGMEKRAEDMAKALISGGDIISFVKRRCIENGLTYPGWTGKTQERIALVLELAAPLQEDH